MNIVKSRETWVDNVKVVACILVVLGHFYQSMTKSNILPTNQLYLWFNQTIYYFHVPLFFICSGYLYQTFSKVNTFKSWSQNILKKLIVLGIPYFTFSLLTWILKSCFSSSVNSEAGRLLDALLVHPSSPYWYLYALFLMFVITPTVSSNSGMIRLISIAVMLKIVNIFGGGGYTCF